MSQNVSLWGADYSNVPGVELPKTGGGSALFTDVTPTTAAAADVASGKIFFDASGVQTTGTASGGGSIKQFALRPDATKIKSFAFDKLMLEDGLQASMPAYNSSGLSILAVQSLSPTVSVDTSTYDYCLTYRYIGFPIYSDISASSGRSVCFVLAGECEFISFSGDISYAGARNSSTPHADFQVSVSLAQRHFYVNNNYLLSGSSQYGAYATIPSVPTISNGEMTVKSPRLYLKGHSTQFKNTEWAKMTDVRYQYVIEVWRAPRSSRTTDGWILQNNILHVMDCYNTNSHTLT